MIAALLILAALVFFASRDEDAPSVTTPTTPTTPAPPGYVPGLEPLLAVRTRHNPLTIFSLLIAKGLTRKGAALATAHAISESYQRGALESYNFNYWNFGFPSWWSSWVGSAGTGRAERTDGVRWTVTFPNVLHAVLGYLEIMRRGRPTAYRELFKVEPSLDLFLGSLCPAMYGRTGTNYAGACNTIYPSSISANYSNTLRDFV